MSFSSGFGSSSSTRKGGAKREQTKEELLQAVRAERTLRNESRQRIKAALTVERYWRGYICRQRIRAEILHAFVQDFGAAVSNTTQYVPVTKLADDAIPSLLLCFWCSSSKHTQQLLQGQPNSSIHKTASAAPTIKGLIALLLRSISAVDAASNYCVLALDPDRQVQWRWQCARLLLLCSSLIAPGGSSGAAEGGALMDAACARLLVLLLEPAHWKLQVPDRSGADGAVEAVLKLLAKTPMPLLAAVQRALAGLHGPQPAAPKVAGQVAQRVVTAALHLLRTCPEAVTQPFVRHVLCVHGAAALYQQPSLPSARSAEEGSFLEAAGKLASGGQLRAAEAAAAVGNLIKILAASSSLEMPEVACRYCSTISALLQSVVAALRKHPSEAAGVASATADWGLLADSRHLEKLQATVAKLPGSSEEGTQAFTSLCVTLVTQLPLIHDLLRKAPPAPSASPPSPAPAIPAPLNTLAFSPTFLPGLWKWLAVNLGLPLEAPASATRGLDVASLAGGFSSLLPHHAAPLALFCRVLQHLLLVLDDTELHDLQRPITLGQARAVATSLNALVFHTFFPASSLQLQQSTSGHTLLSEYAPLALRALYERDVRRSFCQSLLWVAPYNEMTGGSGVVAGGPGKDGEVRMIGGFNAEAVVACLCGREDEEEDGGALQAETGAGRRPASLAGLLKVAPQCVPFTHRVELFRVLLAHDKQRGRFHLAPIEGGVPPIQVTIRRAALMDDAYSALGGGRGGDLRRRLVVTFVNQAGLLEAGLDQGGLMKEFLEQVVQTGLEGGYGLFQASQQGLAYPCPTADKIHMGLNLLEFLGSMVGKALYEGILLEAALAPFFVLRLQGRAPTFDDLLSLDPELHRSLTQVKRYDGDVEDLGLTFTAEHDFFGQTISHDLLPGRGSETVTSSTRLLYCHLLADWHLTSRLGRPADAFARGLSSVIPLTSLRLFNPGEFNELISGGSDTGGLDPEDLQKYAQYSGGYGASSTAVKLFWKVVGGMTPQQRASLLKFVTSCSRPPLGGFQHLQPPFTIHKVDAPASLLAAVGGKDVDRLPSASTCYNMLKLPNYRRAATMREKLLYAIGSSAGFELS